VSLATVCCWGVAHTWLVALCVVAVGSASAACAAASVFRCCCCFSCAAHTLLVVRIRQIAPDPDFRKLFTKLFRDFDDEILSKPFIETAGSTYDDVCHCRFL
jgi:hypothetical protein